jgi:hypothetical protein
LCTTGEVLETAQQRIKGSALFNGQPFCCAVLRCVQSYYERLQEITLQEMQQEEEDQTLHADDTIASLALQYSPSSEQQAATLGSSKPAAITAAATAGTGAAAAAGGAAAGLARAGSRDRDASKQKAAAGVAAARAGSSGDGVGVGGRKRRTVRQGQSRGAAAAGEGDAEEGEDVCMAGVDAAADGADVEDRAGSGGPDGEATAAAAAVKGPSSKRRATLAAPAAAAAAAEAAGSGRQARRTTMAPTARAAAGAAAAAANKSPLPAARPNSSRLAGWDGTPAAAAVPAGLADRPPFTVGGPLTGGAAAGGVGAGVGCASGAAAAAAAAGTVKADRGALQKLQAALDAKCEELIGVRDQLKESQVITS